jgi:hypothetical protein
VGETEVREESGLEDRLKTGWGMNHDGMGALSRPSIHLNLASDVFLAPDVTVSLAPPLAHGQCMRSVRAPLPL